MKRLLIVVIALVALGCSHANYSRIEHYDNNIFMLKPYEILSKDLVTIELAQIEKSTSMSTRPEPIKTVHQQIMEKIREQYPKADAVLIANLQSTGTISTDFSGSGVSEYKYVIDVYPIRYK